jgi:hypothetical protein
MRELFHELTSSWTGAIKYLGRIWILGWTMLGKSVLAYFIALIFLTPLGVVPLLFEKIPVLQRNTPDSLILRVAIGLFVLLIYVPLVFYVAGSWVGFCRRIDPSDDES